MKSKGLPAKSLWAIVSLAVLVPLAVATAIKLSTNKPVAPNAGTKAAASACEEIINSIKGIPGDKTGRPDPEMVQRVLKSLCAQRPDCIYSAEKRNCIANKVCGNLDQQCCNVSAGGSSSSSGGGLQRPSDSDRGKNGSSSSGGGRQDPKTEGRQFCQPGLICASGICRRTTPPVPTTPPRPTTTPKPSVSPTPTTNPKCGVNNYSVGTPCSKPSSTYRNAKYSCYNGQTGMVDLGRCATSSELYSAAVSRCSYSCQTPTKYPTPPAGR